MATDAQVAANRFNARASTGPTSAEARERVRLNAVRHGLATTAAMVLPDEDREAFEGLRERLWLDLLPEGELQEQLAERAAMLLWRLARAGRLETALFRQGDLTAEKSRIGGRLELRKRRRELPQTNNHLTYASEAEGARLDAIESGLDAVPLAPAFAEDARGAQVFDRLSRHETTLQRALRETLVDLARLRREAAARATGDSARVIEGEAGQAA